jgi:hypothetical protein
MSMPTYYAIQLKKAALLGELRVNDVPLYRWRDGKPVRIGRPINLWIPGRSGEVAASVGLPEGSKPGQPPPELEITIAAGSQPEQKTTEAPAIAHYVLDPAVVPSTGRVPVRLNFVAAEVPPSLFWPIAQRVELTDQARASILGVLRELHDALSARDVIRACDLLDFKALEVARCGYRSEAWARQSQREFLEFVTGSPGFSLAPLIPDRLRFQLVAGERLVWVTQDESEPALQSANTGGPQFQLPVYLAPVHGRWTVVR